MRSLFQEIDFCCENVIANPPFETAECAAFLRWLGDVQYPGDKAVLLLPAGFIDKQRPKTVPNVVRRFSALYRTPMQESFARTNCRAAIVVLERV